jgi:ABC-2 type transport system ATP-binding protein
MAAKLAIEAHGLVKAYGDTQVVDGLDLAVPAGQVYGLLGPNGAGKTTTVRMLATLLRPDGGTATVFGHDVVRDGDAVRRLISLTGQSASLDGDLSGRENLVLQARLRGFSRPEARRRADELLEAFELVDAAGRPAKTYSGGMRRRLDVAISAIVTPALLFLDEPTTGLDPASRAQVWQIVQAMAADGTTVLLTTQYLDEADRLADRVAVIDRGAVVAEGTPSKLKAAVGSGALRVRLHDPAQRAEATQLVATAVGVPVPPATDPAVIEVQVDVADRAVRALADLAHAGIATAAFDLAQPSLDDVFLALTGTGTGTGTQHRKDIPA